MESLAGPGGTVTLREDLIVSAGKITPGEPLEKHELGHAEQARELGQAAYHAKYAFDYEQTRHDLASGKIDPLALHVNITHDLIYANHPMEIDANRRAGLPDNRHVQGR